MLAKRSDSLLRTCRFLVYLAETTLTSTEQYSYVSNIVGSRKKLSLHVISSEEARLIIFMSKIIDALRKYEVVWLV